MQQIIFLKKKKKTQRKTQSESLNTVCIFICLQVSGMWGRGSGGVFENNTAEWNVHGLQLDWSNLETPEEKRAPRALGPL